MDDGPEQRRCDGGREMMACERSFVAAATNALPFPAAPAIPPPFPYPSQWHEVFQNSGIVAGVQWLHPKHQAHRPLHTPLHTVRIQHPLADEAGLELDDDSDSSGSDVEFVLSEEWAERFRKTAERRAQRAAARRQESRGHRGRGAMKANGRSTEREMVALESVPIAFEQPPSRTGGKVHTIEQEDSYGAEAAARIAEMEAVANVRYDELWHRREVVLWPAL